MIGNAQSQIVLSQFVYWSAIIHSVILKLKIVAIVKVKLEKSKLHFFLKKPKQIQLAVIVNDKNIISLIFAIKKIIQIIILFINYFLILVLYIIINLRNKLLLF